MGEVIEQEDLSLLKNFYYDHIVRQQKNFSFSTLFLVQPVGGNGLPKLMPNQMTQARTLVSAEDIKRAIKLFTALCIYLFPQLVLQARKRLASIIQQLGQERFFSGDTGVDKIRDEILLAMKNDFTKNKRTQALEYFFQEFPAYKDTGGTSTNNTPLYSQKSSLFETLKSLITTPGKDSQIEEARKKLCGNLILNRSTKNISDLLAELQLLKDSGTPETSLKNIALLLLTRNFFHTSFSKEVGKHLVETYHLSFDDVITMINKKKNEQELGRVSMENLSFLSDLFNRQVIEGNKHREALYEELFLLKYTTGNLEMCRHLIKDCPSLSSRESIIQMVDVLVGVGRIENKLTHYEVVSHYLKDASLPGMQKAVLFIRSIPSNAALWERFFSNITSYFQLQKLDLATMQYVVSLADDMHDMRKYTPLFKLYIKQLLIRGEHDKKNISPLHEFLSSHTLFPGDIFSLVHDCFFSYTESKELDAEFYPKKRFNYVKSVRLLPEKTLEEEIVRWLVRTRSSLFLQYSVKDIAHTMNKLKTNIIEQTPSLSAEERWQIISMHNKNSSYAEVFFYTDIFQEPIDQEGKQKCFYAYLKTLFSDYKEVKALLTYVGDRYGYEKDSIMKEVVDNLCATHKFSDARDVAKKEGLGKELLRLIDESKISSLWENKKVTEYIALPKLHILYNDSELIREFIAKTIEEIDITNNSTKFVKYNEFLTKITPIFLDEKFHGNEKIKTLLAKKALDRCATRSSPPKESLKLYQYLQLHYGNNLSEVQKSALHKRRRLYRTTNEKISSCINEYALVFAYTKQMLEYFTNKKVPQAQQQEKKDIILERQELLDNIPLYEYNNLFSHLNRSVNKVNQDERLREPRNYPYDSWYRNKQREDDIIYYDTMQIPLQFKELIDQKLSHVPAKDQRKLKRETMEAWFEFYEYQKDYDGLTMLEKEYGYTLDRTEEKKKALRSFLEHGEKEKITQLTELIALFGMSNATDILYQLYPEYTGLPKEDIEAILSQYLGELLLNHKGIGVHYIPDYLNISGLGFGDSLFTVIERDFVRVFTETKKAHLQQTDKEICESYLNDLAKKFATVTGDHPQLKTVYTHFSAFITKVLAVQKPEKFIDYLTEGREFPDFLQKLNAALVADKKRFLIADGMGLGKSLSAILAKEHSRANKCLVVVPSLLIGTWQGYSSDSNDPAIKKRGYYKLGSAPKVVTINSPSDIALLGNESYDYVLISQEKLQGDEYVDALIGQKFDFMIVDEIHKLKNISEGKRAGGLLRVTEHIETHQGLLCLLSGTPIPNKVVDIAILLKLLYPEKYATVENDVLVNSIINGSDLLNLRSLLLPMMQMKKLTDHIDMPELIQTVKHLSLSSEEQLYYDAFVEDNTMTGPEKVMKLRKFLLNPQLVGVDHIAQSSKAKMIGQDANKLFETKDKIVFFVNGFRSGVLRQKEGVDTTFIEQMGLSDDIEVRIIDGTNTTERQAIQDEFNSSNKKIALFISGSTADVGIDLTAGEHIIHINEPRTQADIDQQEARVYRYGQLKDIETTTYITSGTLEQGIHDYIAMKHQIIMKLYYGLKLSALERRVITESEVEEKKGSAAVNTTLMKFIRSAKEKLNNMFGYLREGGYERIESLVERRGKQMAEYYALLGPRSYQANVNRMHATLVKKLFPDKDFDISQLKIVDLGSGPKMLEQHIDESLQNQVISVDINPNHFIQEDIDSGKAVVSNFASLPFEDNEIDCCCSSLAFNETARSRSEKEYERLDVLLEMHRVLKPGGIAMISTIYSLQYKHPEALKTLLDELGFEIISDYSGIITGDTTSSFQTKTLVLRKKEQFDHGRHRYYSTTSYLQDLVKRDDIKGLDLVKDKVSLSDQEYVLEEIEIVPLDEKRKSSTMKLHLSKSGKVIKETEETYKNLVEEMQLTDGVKHIADIKATTLQKWGFGRYKNNSSCVIMTRLPNNAGLFRYSMPLKKV